MTRIPASTHRHLRPKAPLRASRGASASRSPPRSRSRCSSQPRVGDRCARRRARARGVTLAVKQHWLAPDEAQRYRADVTRALRDIFTLPKLRGQRHRRRSSSRSRRCGTRTRSRARSRSSRSSRRTSTTSRRTSSRRAHRRRRRRRRRLPLVPRQGPRVPSARVVRRAERRRARAGPATRRRRSPPRSSRAASRAATRLIWEYSFNFGFGRPPWASGMAQAVAAQALSRAAALLEDPTSRAAAARAYAAVPPLTLQLPTGPWVRLYGFNREVVLNAQLQAVLSLLQYADDRATPSAAALAQRLDASAQAMLPALRHGRLVAVRARRRVRDEGVPAVRDAAAREARARRRRTRSGSTRRSASTATTTTRRRSRPARRRRRSIRSRSTASSTSRRSRSRCRRTRPSRSPSRARSRPSGSRAARTR